VANGLFWYLERTVPGTLKWLYPTAPQRTEGWLATEITRAGESLPACLLTIRAMTLVSLGSHRCGRALLLPAGVHCPAMCQRAGHAVIVYATRHSCLLKPLVKEVHGPTPSVHRPVPTDSMRLTLMPLPCAYADSNP
jgi:hypothetical protein